MTLLSSGALALAVALVVAGLGWVSGRARRISDWRPCFFQVSLLIGLAAVAALVSASPSLARRSHATQTSSATPTPANAGEAVCRSKARDYAYEKHADIGQERLFFDRCMGH
jgi:hypothetical protein